MNTRENRVRRPRRASTIVLGAVAPLMLVAGVIGMGARAEATGVSARPSHSAPVANNPLQCIEADMQCAKAAASGDACDLLAC